MAKTTRFDEQQMAAIRSRHARDCMDRLYRDPAFALQIAVNLLGGQFRVRTSEVTGPDGALMKAFAYVDVSGAPSVSGLFNEAGVARMSVDMTSTDIERIGEQLFPAAAAAPAAATPKGPFKKATTATFKKATTTTTTGDDEDVAPDFS